MLPMVTASTATRPRAAARTRQSPSPLLVVRGPRKRPARRRLGANVRVTRIPSAHGTLQRFNRNGHTASRTRRLDGLIVAVPLEQPHRASPQRSLVNRLERRPRELSCRRAIARAERVVGIVEQQIGRAERIAEQEAGERDRSRAGLLSALQPCCEQEQQLARFLQLAAVERHRHDPRGPRRLTRLPYQPPQARRQVTAAAAARQLPRAQPARRIRGRIRPLGKLAIQTGARQPHPHRQRERPAGRISTDRAQGTVGNRHTRSPRIPTIRGRPDSRNGLQSPSSVSSAAPAADSTTRACTAQRQTMATDEWLERGSSLLLHDEFRIGGGLADGQPLWDERRAAVAPPPTRLRRWPARTPLAIRDARAALTRSQPGIS